MGMEKCTLPRFFVYFTQKQDLCRPVPSDLDSSGQNAESDLPAFFVSCLSDVRYIGTILDCVGFLTYFLLSFIVDFNCERCF